MSGVPESDLSRVKVCLADYVELASSVFEFSGATGDYRYRVGHDREETGCAEVFELNSCQLSLNDWPRFVEEDMSYNKSRRRFYIGSSRS